MHIDFSQQERIIDSGNRLADLSEEEGGWAEFFEGDLAIDDPVRRATAAHLLENGKIWLYQKVGGTVDSEGRVHLNEAGRSSVLGGYTDHFFPIIRASIPTSPLNDLVAIQPTTRRNATIGYMDITYGSTKGTVVAGQKWVDAQVGLVTPTGVPSISDYSSESINGETVGAATNAAAFSGTLKWSTGSGVRPGSIVIKGTLTTGGAVTFVDNGIGGFVVASAATGTPTIASSTINYNTGAFTITVSGDTFVNATAVTANYRWNSEAGDLPEIDIVPRITMVETVRRGLRTNVSAEAQFDFQMEFGMSYTDQVTTVAAAMINYETAMEALNLLWNGTPVYTSYDVTIPSGVTRNDHTQDLVFKLNLASSAIWKNLGGQGYGNVLVVDELAAAHFETLSGDDWVAAPRPPVGMAMGLHRIGTLKGKFEVYKFMNLSRMPGASPYGNILMLWRGTGFAEAGLIMAPYQAFYTTEPNQTANFVTQQGFATRYALKLVNPLCQVRITFTQS